MCTHAYGHFRHRHHMRDAESFFVVVVAMIREALAVLANARRDLEDIANGTTRATTVGSDIKPRENHLNVPL
ncbi:MAG: hypothetical protein JO322_05715 [Candidatus Eremiobacteraeota bacterium]|nr:hypothetical protein [Candidatus Eremiobacteraeota bacterium]